MKTKKNLARVLAALLALAMLMCAVGCSKGENTTGDNTQSTSNNTSGNTTTTAPNDGTTGGDNTNTTAPEDDEPDVYVISGVWKFNEKLNVPHLTEDNRNWGFTEELNFTSNGVVFDRFLDVTAWRYDDTCTCLVLEYVLLSSSSGERAYESFDTPAKWLNEAYRTVDFGDIPQEVSKGFYEWFVENAVKQ